MPLQLGARTQCGFLSAKETIDCNSLVTNSLQTKALSLQSLQLSTLEVDTLGSVLHPVHTIHRASTDVFQNDLRFIEESSRETRAAIRTDGHLAICQDLDLFDGTNLETATKKWSVGVNPRGDFVIRDEVTGRAGLTLFQEGGMELDAEANLDTGVAFLTSQAFEAYRAQIQQAQDALITQVEALVASGGGGGGGGGVSTQEFEAFQAATQQAQTNLETQVQELVANETPTGTLALSNALESLVEKLRTVQRARVLKITVSL